MKAEKFLTALLLATGAAVYATFTDGGAGAVSPIELSGFAAGLMKAAGVRAPLDGLERPIRSGLAARFITARSVRASEALRGTERVPPGSVVIWRRGNGPFGHAGFAVAWDGAGGETVEGNTSSGEAGSQRDGEGVWRRRRAIQPGSYFRVVSFTPVDTASWR